MRKRILIKHSKPEMIEGQTSHDWPLSEEGRRRCIGLADLLRPHVPTIIVTSDEPKAVETGEIVARALGIKTEAAAGLQEHDRSNVPVMQTRDFISAMAHFFQNPNDRVLGQESAREALSRFKEAVETAMDSHSDGNVALVTHGTVLALFLAGAAGKCAFEWWRKMGLPSFVVMEWPGRDVEVVVEGM